MPLPEWARPALTKLTEPAVDEIQRAVDESSYVFFSVSAALRSAFRWEVASAPNISQALADMRQDGSKGKGDLSATDMAAQSALTMRICRATLTAFDWDVVLAYYTHPEGQLLRKRKLESLNRVLDHFKAKSGGPERFKSGVGMEWCSLRRSQPLTHWAGRYQVTPTTIARWKFGKAEHRHKPGIIALLDLQLVIVHNQLEGPFITQKVIPE